MYLFLSIYLFGLLGFLIHYFILPKKQRTKKRTIELFLLYQIVFSLGITSLVAFFGLTFMDEYIAQYTNWPPCPFEQQLANVNLAFAVLGVMCIWYRKEFWLATIIGFSVWIIGDGFHHLYEYFVLNNISPGNIGVPLWTDFIIPLLLLGLLFFYWNE
jgi:hypothetical protein